MIVAFFIVAAILAVIALMVFATGRTTAASVVGSMALIAFGAALVLNLLHN